MNWSFTFKIVLIDSLLVAAGWKRLGAWDIRLTPSRFNRQHAQHAWARKLSKSVVALISESVIALIIGDQRRSQYIFYIILNEDSIKQ